MLLDLEEVGPRPLSPQAAALCWALNPREAPAFDLRGGPRDIHTMKVPSLPEELGLWGDRDPGGARGHTEWEAGTLFPVGLQGLPVTRQGLGMQV